MKLRLFAYRYDRTTIELWWRVHVPICLLRQLFESEMRNAIVEAETREEVMQEMEERMRSMEKMYTRRLAQEVSPFIALVFAAI